VQLHNTSQYAIRILSYISSRDDEVSFTAKELAENLEISYKFLTKIMGELVKADIVQSTRGRDGGYTLNKPANKITISDILEIFNDSIHEERCILGIGFCDSKNKCVLHDQWIEPKNLIQHMFNETTLDKLVGKGCKI
jgi:Rrf2 family protein